MSYEKALEIAARLKRSVQENRGMTSESKGVSPEARAVRLYNKTRDIMAMDEAGRYYCKHIDAMTAEKLHHKSDIAAELGWRDQQIDALARTVEELRKERDSARAALEKYGRHDDGCEINELIGPCHCGFRAALTTDTREMK